MSDATHSDIIHEIRDLRKEIAPLVEMAPKLEAMAEIYSAATVGGRLVKWLAGLGAGIISIWAFAKLLAGELVK